MGGILDFFDCRGIFLLHSLATENKNNEGKRKKVNAAIRF